MAKRDNAAPGDRPAGRGQRPGFLVMGLGLLLACLLVMGLAAWGAWVASAWALDALVDLVPPAWEVRQAQLFADTRDDRPCDDPLVKPAITAIAERVIKALPADQPFPVHVRVLWNDDENAYALPGGEIVITSGLVAQAESPDEIAGILGHEAQHVLGRHAFRAMAHKAGLALVTAYVLGGDDHLAFLASKGNELVGLAFDRSQEAEADRAGVGYASRAGFRPQALGQFFRREQARAGTGATAARVVALFSTHPADADRYTAIDAVVSELPPWHARPLPEAARWRQVRERAGAIPPAIRAQLEAIKAKAEQDDAE